MTKKERLNKLIQDYIENNSAANQIVEILSNNTLYFNYYYLDSDGTKKTSYPSHQKGSGIYQDFVTSSSYPSAFSLLEVKLTNQDLTVYVSLEAISFNDDK